MFRSSWNSFNLNILNGYIRSSSDWPRACCSSSCADIVWFNCTSRTSSKSSSIWPESGLKRRSPGSKKHMLIRSIDVRIRTRRDHFWTSSVLVEQLQVKIHVQKFEEMEWSAEPIGSRANTTKINSLSIRILNHFYEFSIKFAKYYNFIDKYRNPQNKIPDQLCETSPLLC